MAIPDWMNPFSNQNPYSSKPMTRANTAPNPYSAKPTGSLSGKVVGGGAGITAGGLSTAAAVAAPLVLGGSEDSGIKWRRLGYPSKAAYDTAVSQNSNRNKPITADNPVRKPRPRGMADYRGSVTPGSMEPAATNLGEGIQMQIAERHRAGAGYPAGVQKPDYYPVESRQILPAETTKRNINDIEQTGKELGGGGTPIDMSRSFNDLLNGVKQQPFGGSQLPTTMGNPYTATYKQTQGFGDEFPDIGGYNGATFDSKLGSLAASSKDISQFAPITGREVPIDGGAERIGLAATGITSSRLSDALNSVRSEVEMTPERRQLMARAAFLDTEKSMEALRAKEAVNGVVFAQNRHYISGKSGDDQAIGIDRSQARDISSGRSSAQSLLEAHIAKNKDVSEDTPASAQNPLSEAGEAIKSAFAAGAQTDFVLNNNQVGPRTGVGPVVDPNIIENYDFTKPGAEEAYFKKLNSGGFFR